MKYIIMAGGNNVYFETPPQLLRFNGEMLVDRTIRLLMNNQITDIAISSNDPRFEGHQVPVLHQDRKSVV